MVILAGLRPLHFIPNILCFVINVIVAVWLEKYIAGAIIILLGALWTDLLIILWGSQNLRRFTPSGGFKVGYTEFTSERYKNKVAVFYPIDKEEFSNKIGMWHFSENNSLWCRDGAKTTTGIRNATGSDKKATPPAWLYKSWRGVRMETVENGQISQ